MRIPFAAARVRAWADAWLVPFALLAVCLVLNVWMARTLDMHRTAPMWIEQATPVALASLEFGHRCDYTGSFQVLGLFHDADKKYPGATLNQQIRYALDHRDAVHAHLPYLAGCDDKGIIDFLKLGFWLFGFTIKSAVDLYFLLLGVSSLLFLVRFRARKWALLLLFGFLMAHYCVLPLVALNPNLLSVLALRFMSVLSMVAALHLALDVVLPQPGLVRWLTLLGQALLLLFTLHIRCAAVWQVICVLLVYLLALSWRFVVRPRQEEIGRRWAPSWVPALLALLAPLALTAYKHTVYAPSYFLVGNDSHCFWHSVYSGLAYSPELAEEYRLRIDDESIFGATERFLFAHGRADDWFHLGDGNGLYEKAVRSMFFHTLREHFGEVTRTVLIHKPRALAQYVAWFMRLAAEPPCIHILWNGADGELHCMAAHMDAEGSFFRPFRLECALILLVCVLWTRGEIGPHWKRWTAAFAVYAGCSTLPSLLGYPTAHTSNDFLIVVGMVVYVGYAALLALLLRRWRHRVA